MTIYDNQGRELITLAHAQSRGLGNRHTLKALIHRGILQGFKVGKTHLVIKEILEGKKHANVQL